MIADGVELVTNQLG